MTKGVWRIRLRIHFARDVADCENALRETILWIERHFCKNSLKRMTTHEGNRKHNAEYNDKELQKALEIHRSGPGFAPRATVIDDGVTQFVRQKCHMEVITYNQWREGFYPFQAQTAYSNPSYIQCFWSPDESGGAVTSTQLNELLELSATSLNIFYAWAGWCYSLPYSTGFKLQQIRAATDEVMEAVLSKCNADITDGEDIDYREQIRGVFWVNCLGPGHIRALGGIDKLLKMVKSFSPKRIGEDHISLSLSDLPTFECSDEVFQRYAAFADCLKDIFPKPTIRPSWYYRYEARLADNRILLPTLWLRRFIDENYLEKRGFELATVKKKINK